MARENMVFGGSTNYDSNDQALLNLLEQGPRFMYGYSFRRALASAAKNPALLSSHALVPGQRRPRHDLRQPHNWSCLARTAGCELAGVGLVQQCPTS